MWVSGLQWNFRRLLHSDFVCKIWSTAEIVSCFVRFWVKTVKDVKPVGQNSEVAKRIFQTSGTSLRRTLSARGKIYLVLSLFVFESEFCWVCPLAEAWPSFALSFLVKKELQNMFWIQIRILLGQWIRIQWIWIRNAAGKLPAPAGATIYLIFLSSF